MNNTEANGQEENVNIFIARQPIFDTKKNVYAYELLYRSDAVNRAYISNDNFATLKVMGNSLLIGLQKLIADKRALIHFNRELLLGKLPFLFPRDLLAVELQGLRRVDTRIIQSLEKVKKAGYPVVLDHEMFNAFKDNSDLLNLADIIKVDFNVTSPQERLVIKESTKGIGVELLAEKVETKANFEEAQQLGFPYWQGFYFQEPVLITRQKMPGYKIHYLQVLNKLHDANVDFKEIEEIIKRDVSLTYKLFRFINSASYGFRVTIRSISHAFLLLGKREMRNWLTIIIMSGIGKDSTPELTNTAVIRARFCETVATVYKLGSKPEDLFLIGMFSLAEAFLGLPMKEVLDELPLEDSVKDALLGQESEGGDVLKMVAAYEKANWEEFMALAGKLKMNENKLVSIYMDAVEWSKFLSK
ncbi:MAG: HDOD domain-containing protein [bacterium]|nr:HDOD domain-containing protein [bacterium]